MEFFCSRNAFLRKLLPEFCRKRQFSTPRKYCIILQKSTPISYTFRMLFCSVYMVTTDGRIIPGPKFMTRSKSQIKQVLKRNWGLFWHAEILTCTSQHSMVTIFDAFNHSATLIQYSMSGPAPVGRPLPPQRHREIPELVEPGQS